MKRLFVLTITLLLALSTVPVYAQTKEPPATPEELKYYDAQIDVLLPKLVSFESEYKDINRRYYQALTSHDVVPEVPTIPDKLEASPTDQVETLAYFWTEKAFLPEQLAWAISIDTYDGPSGTGYVLNITTMLYKETWRKSINYGPEDYRTSDWYQVLPDEF